jgi:hypothetical protein
LAPKRRLIACNPRSRADTAPDGYAAVQREYRGELGVELAPGAAATVDFVLTPIARDIRMLPPLVVR